MNDAVTSLENKIDPTTEDKSAYFLFSILYYLKSVMAFLFLFFGCALSHTLFENILT